MNNPHFDNVKTTSTRQERVQRKEDAIIRAARDMFLEYGFNGTTMARIARTADVADGTLYTYFQNKEALARAVVTDFYQRLTRTAQDGVDGLTTTHERLAFLAHHHMVNVMAERKILAMLPLIDLELESYEGSELFDLNKTYVVIFDRVVKDARARGDISQNHTLWILRDIFFGGLDYGSRTMLIKARPEAVDMFVDEMVSLIVKPQPIEPVQGLDSLAQRLETSAKRLENMLEKYEND